MAHVGEELALRAVRRLRARSRVLGLRHQARVLERDRGQLREALEHLHGGRVERLASAALVHQPDDAAHAARSRQGHRDHRLEQVVSDLAVGFGPVSVVSQQERPLGAPDVGRAASVRRRVAAARVPKEAEPRAVLERAVVLAQQAEKAVPRVEERDRAAEQLMQELRGICPANQRGSRLVQRVEEVLLSILGDDARLELRQQLLHLDELRDDELRGDLRCAPRHAHLLEQQRVLVDQLLVGARTSVRSSGHDDTSEPRLAVGSASSRSASVAARSSTSRPCAP